MITLRQLEALVWIVRLGTFERAASKLNTTQAAISKRIKELEATLQIQIFERSGRKSILSVYGRDLFNQAEKILDLVDTVHRSRQQDATALRVFRFGVTGISSLTWLPNFVHRLSKRAPDLAIQPMVEESRALFNALKDDMLDLIVLPDLFQHPDISSIKLEAVSYSWYASTSLLEKGRRYTMEEISRYKLIGQGPRAGSWTLVNGWLESRNIEFKSRITCGSLTALMGLTASGFGVTYLPHPSFYQFSKRNNLFPFETEFELPILPYSAMYRRERYREIPADVLETLQDCCNFNMQYQL